VPAHRAVREVIAATGGVTVASTLLEWAAMLREAAPNDEIRNLLTQFSVEAPKVSVESDARYPGELLSGIMGAQLDRALDQLKAKLVRLNPVEQVEDYNRMFGDLVALEQRRRMLRERGIEGL